MRESKLADRTAPLMPGFEPIPGYVLVRRRGRGGFGEVWEAETTIGLRVALKFVHGTGRAQSGEFRALELTRHIRHPHLLANFAAWQIGGRLVVGMELADGSLWDRYIRSADEGLGGIPRSELLGYLGDAAEALDWLNQPSHTLAGRPGLGVQHRDIKPPNILIFGDRAKVADLGMARAIDGERSEPSGTCSFPYAPPEFFEGRAARESDHYGLAVSYCQVRRGRLPFEGDAASMTAGHLYGVPDLSGLPEAEVPIIARALAKKADDRWPDCRSLIAVLRDLDPIESPETLTRIEEPAEPVRSSTGFAWVSSADSGNTPPPSWRPFEPGGGLEALMRTPETPLPEESRPR